MNIVCTPAVGHKYESASLTRLSKKILDDGLWALFEELKLKALVRFFDGMQPEDARHFMKFMKKDSINTERYNRTSSGGTHYENERVFANCSKSVMFTQPQRGYTYLIDPAAKQTISEVFSHELEAE